MQQEERLRKALERAQANTKRPVNQTPNNTKHNTLNVGDRPYKRKHHTWQPLPDRCQCIDIDTDTNINFVISDGEEADASLTTSGDWAVSEQWWQRHWHGEGEAALLLHLNPSSLDHGPWWIFSSWCVLYVNVKLKFNCRYVQIILWRVDTLPVHFHCHMVASRDPEIRSMCRG